MHSTTKPTDRLIKTTRDVGAATRLQSLTKQPPLKQAKAKTRKAKVAHKH